MKMEQTECSETSEYKIQTPENYPEEKYNIAVNIYQFTGRHNPDDFTATAVITSNFTSPLTFQMPHIMYRFIKYKDGTNLSL